MEVKPLRRPIRVPARQRLLFAEFSRFGLVGLAGFGVDTALVYGLAAPLGLYGGGLIAWLAAATTTWALNRAWTFAGRTDGRGGRFARLRQWAVFLGANLLGGVLNRSAFFLLVAFVPACAAHPVLAILAGVGAGMLANFGMSQRFVFPAMIASAAIKAVSTTSPVVTRGSPCFGEPGGSCRAAPDAANQRSSRDAP